MKTHENGYRGEHRVRGCMVHTLDMKRLETHALKVMAAMHGMSVETLVSKGYALSDRKLVIGEDDHEEIWIVSTEGVGWKEDDCGNVDVYLKPSPMSMSMLPVPIPARVLRTFIEEEIDLADYIRTFGDRLESNFSLFYNKFMQASNEEEPTQKTVYIATVHKSSDRIAPWDPVILTLRIEAECIEDAQDLAQETLDNCIDDFVPNIDLTVDMADVYPYDTAAVEAIEFGKFQLDYEVITSAIEDARQRMHIVLTPAKEA